MNENVTVISQRQITSIYGLEKIKIYSFIESTLWGKNTFYRYQFVDRLKSRNGFSVTVFVPRGSTGLRKEYKGIQSLPG